MLVWLNLTQCSLQTVWHYNENYTHQPVIFGAHFDYCPPLFCELTRCSERAQPISVWCSNRKWRRQRRHIRSVLLKTENHHDVSSVTCRPCLFVLVYYKEVVSQRRFLKVSVIQDGVKTLFGNGGGCLARACFMNSQFTSLRIEQSAEGYSGVKWSLARFRRAN